jgi:hypothetical protein
MMNMLESYHICKAPKQGIQLNEALIEPYNPIFEIISTNRLNNYPSTTYNQIPPHSLPSSLLSAFKFEATNVNIETRHTV